VDTQATNMKRPDFCVVEVSHRCMFKCKMCNYWMSKTDIEELELRHLYKFISSLKDFVGMPFEMNISGGETLMKRGILDLVEFIAAQGFRFSMVTNGFLIDKGTAKRIADSGLSFLAISLDSLDENVHDFLRGRKGARSKVTRALEFFQAHRGKLKNITLQTIVMGQNLDSILDLVEWGKDKQVSHSFMAVTRPNMIPADLQWYKKDEFNFLWPKDTDKVLNILEELIKLKKSGYRIDNPIGQLEKFKLYFSDPEKFVRDTPCSLGDGIIHINPKGDVYLCCEMDSVGNVKETEIGTIWESQKAENIRQQIRLCQRNCAGMVNCYRE
jgi:Fe-coproporphyrin III synthase